MKQEKNLISLKIINIYISLTSSFCMVSLRGEVEKLLSLAHLFRYLSRVSSFYDAKWSSRVREQQLLSRSVVRQRTRRER